MKFAPLFEWEEILMLLLVMTLVASLYFWAN